MRYRLHTLLILMAIVPAMIALMWLTASDPLVCVGFYGTTAGLMLLYHLVAPLP